MISGSVKKRRVRSPLTSARNAALLLLPTLLLIAIYKYGPIGQAVVASGQSFSVAGIPLGWVGLGNYERALADQVFLQSLGLTVAFAAIKIPVQLALGFSLAMFLFQSTKLNGFFRVIIITPAVTPIAIVGIIFLFLFDREVGLTNAVLTAFGTGRVGWLTEPHAAQFVVIFASIWRDAGFAMLFYLAGLTAIPQEVLEASRVDGANSWQRSTKILLPMLQRSTQLAAVSTTVAAFQYFAPIFVLTRGGPQNATNVAAYNIYQQAFVFYDQGFANAMAVVLLAVLVVVTAFELYLLRSRWEY
ncbi:MAG: sugar ABC transporter permease [Terrimesophilobacter sp.]